MMMICQSRIVSPVVAMRDGFEMCVGDLRPRRVEVEMPVGPRWALLELAPLLVCVLVMSPRDSAGGHAHFRRRLEERVRVLVLVKAENPR